MAKPKVFVSSTFYDLKHLRSALEGFITQMGFEPILSEKGSIAYAHDIPLDESCYREAEQADIMLLIVGGRYGTERSGGDEKKSTSFYERYISITREEFRSAARNDVPLYILVERAVYAEYQTYLQNIDLTNVTYAHADSANIFQMIDEILSLPKNNPVFQFDRYHEIETWLREQWSGLFGEMLRRKSGNQQMATLANQVAILTEINSTLMRYVEMVMTQASPKKSKSLIESESRRLADVRRYRKIAQIDFVDFVIDYDVDLVQIGDVIENSSAADQILDGLLKITKDPELADELRRFKSGRHDVLLNDINDARKMLGFDALKWKLPANQSKSPRKKRHK